MLRKISAMLFAVLLLSSVPAFSADEAVAPSITIDQALQQLKDGNIRFMKGKMIHPHQNAERRSELMSSQHPFVVVVSCSDSRVPTEIVFDQGIGDIFSVRVAGNIVDDTQLASIEYAVKYLGVTLIVILGHENCGAVNAAIKGYSEPNFIQQLVNQIQPAVEAARLEKGNLLENATKENVRLMDQKMETVGNVLPQLIWKNKIRIIGGYYNLGSGEVEFLPEPEHRRPAK